MARFDSANFFPNHFWSSQMKLPIENWSFNTTCPCVYTHLHKIPSPSTFNAKEPGGLTINNKLGFGSILQGEKTVWQTFSKCDEGNFTQFTWFLVMDFMWSCKMDFTWHGGAHPACPNIRGGGPIHPPSPPMSPTLWFSFWKKSTAAVGQGVFFSLGRHTLCQS